MKLTKYTLLISLVLIGTNYVVAQNDSIIIGSEDNTENLRYYKNKYRYLDVKLSDEDMLFKLGIQPFKPSEDISFMIFALHAGFEQKVNHSITVISELNSIYTLTDEQFWNQFGYSAGGRYYFLKNKEIAAEKSGDNCQGIFALFKFNDLLSVNHVKVDEDPDFPGTGRPLMKRYVLASLTPELGIGFQQKLDYNLYFDASVACNYNIFENDFGLKITFLFGGFLSILN